ncbi:glutamate--cysteine ligase [Actinoplanes lutulentus]|uniref:Glutamate--cysteine ligase EgtA n=1 Tax=Actinoplanes lutulentus TaxID=1287878 RepID=A0A327YYV4_9ACTN|nr:glutamate-cysteine ligase family protein [Actinoplanes lutulentus]MBB2943043.1 glutamate--cysteine ligase [Actinoplanes lutulentus]RAK26690.1 glutamate--cysteine ligase [Actinoplanes lutulentus]
MNSDDRILRSSEEALEHISGICFKTGPPQRVGVELEWTTHHAGDPAAYLRAEDLAAALGGHTPATLGNPHPQPLPGGGAVTVEPGGQIEISSAVADDLAGLHATVSAEQAALTELLARSGIVLGDRGIDPHRPPRRILDTPRYAAMERAFDRAGRTMMGSTAGLQVCFDAGAGRWEVLNEAGPALLALFANSRRHAGRDTRWASARMATWLAMEQRRSGPVPIGDDPALDWARYALDAPLLCVRRDNGSWDAPQGLTLAGWIASDDPPTVDDVEYHLGTLFPPVRPRGYLEVRYLDTQPGGEWIAPAAALVTLLADDSLVDQAREAAAPSAGRWLAAARAGLADPAVRASAAALAELACRNLERTGLPTPVRETVSEILARRLHDVARVAA